MEQSLNSGSDANSWSRSHNYGQTSSGPMCHCRRQTTMVKSWTNDNPGRWFFRCNVHGFFRWVDEEKPHGWQKVSLLEARDQICYQKEEIKRLKDKIEAMNTCGTLAIDSNMVENLEAEKNKLECEATISKEREKLLRQFIVISWGGFIVVTAMILTMGKN